MEEKEFGAKLTFEDCGKVIAAIPTDLKKKNDFANGEHWGANGEYWIGWKPVCNARGEISESAMRQFETIKRAFTTKNVVGANLNRLEGTVLGNEPQFNFIPVREGDNEFYKQIDADFVDYWTQNDVHQKFKEFLSYRAKFGKAAFLVFIPTGFLSEKTNESGSKVYALADGEQDFRKILDKIAIKVLPFTDVNDTLDTLLERKVWVIELNKDADGYSRYGVLYVGKDNKSYFRVVYEDSKKDSIISVNLGGNNLCQGIGDFDKSLISESVIKLQQAVAHAKTGEQLALENINFPEVTFINSAEFFKLDENGNPTNEREEVKQGPGVIRRLIGLAVETVNGMQYMTPSVHEKTPADPEKFTKVADGNCKDIDEQMGMGYKSLSDSEYASGDSKEKSMDDYDILCLDFETAINNIGTKVLENIVRLAFNFMGATNRNKEFKASFKINLNTGKLTNDDKAGMREEVELGVRSKENYMQAVKITDNPANENQKIAEEQALALTHEVEKTKQLAAANPAPARQK